MQTSNYINGISLESFFQNTVVDNNGITVCDINMGLCNLFATFNEHIDDFEETQRYLCRDCEEAYPDALANNSILGNQAYWWWILLLNLLEDPFTEIQPNWIYSINSGEQIAEFISITNQNNSNNNNTRYGSVVELN